jgi:hypothetical protein
MSTFVFFVLFVAIALRRPDVALVIYFLHWCFCKFTNSPTLFDRVEAALKRAFKAMSDGDEKK